MPTLRPLNLKVSVMRRVVLGAMACAFAAASFVVVDSERQTAKHARAKSEVIANNLQLQLLRIEAKLDAQSRFPDWQFLADQVLDEGLCIATS